MSIALDIGSHRIQSLRKEGAKLIGTNLRCAYSVLPDSATYRNLLEHAELAYVVCDEGLLLTGNAAADNSSLFKSTCRTLLPFGKIPAGDPLARQVLASLIESAVPVSGTPGEAKAESPICCVTLPGGADMQSAGRSDLEFFLRCIRLQGYQPRIVPSGAALVLAELVQESFTGIGMVFGDSGCEALLAHRGQPVCHARTEFGGQWIDNRLAEQQKPITFNSTGDRFLDVAAMTQLKHSIAGSIASPTDSFEEALADSMTHSCVSLIEAFGKEIAANSQASDLPQPLPVVCIGGSTQVPGFHELITEVLCSFDLGISVQPPRIVKDSQYTIARGLLIDAELQTSTAKPARAA